MNNDVIKTIFFYDKSYANKTIESRNGNVCERTREEVLDEIKRKIRGHVVLNYTVIQDSKVVTYQLKQEEGIVNLRINLFDEILPTLRDILRPVPRKIAENTNKKSSIKITIGNGTCYASYFSDQCVTSKEISNGAEEVISYIRCLKNNNEIVSSICDGKENLCYIFETTEHEKFKIYVRAEEEEIVQKLNELVVVKVKNKNKKKLAMLTGLTLCGFGVTFFLLKNPSFQQKVHKVHESIIEQRQASELLEDNFFRIKSLYMRFKTSELSDEEMYELNSKLSEVLTFLHAVDSKDECVGILEKYAEEIGMSYHGTRQR